MEVLQTSALPLGYGAKKREQIDRIGLNLPRQGDLTEEIPSTDVTSGYPFRVAAKAL